MKYVFVINSGSSSLKFKLFRAGNLMEELGGIVERIGIGGSFLKVESSGNKERDDYPDGIANHEKALKAVFDKLAYFGYSLSDVSAIGHRGVHGGEKFVASTRMNARNAKELAKYNSLAPLHNPPILSGIKACMKLLPKVPNVTVFDTAFHSTIPDYAHMYAIPYELYKKYGIRRFGFHGTSHHYVAEEAAKMLKKPLSKLRLITCHLGSGASTTAIKYGKSIETSLGFTPLGGLMMGTRTGDVDPGLGLYLVRELGMDPDEVDEMMNKKSGLLGVSGISNDMREILTAAGYKVKGFEMKKKVSPERKKRAKLALKMFIYNIQRYVGQHAMALGKVDAIIFTAGIGERNATVRKMVTDGLGLLGKVRVLVVPTNEELMIAREAKKVSRR